MHLERIAPWKVAYTEAPYAPMQTLYVYGFRRACRRARSLSASGPRAETLVSRRALRALRFSFGPMYKGGRRDDLTEPVR